jgi:hypothetical protein
MFHNIRKKWLFISFLTLIFTQNCSSVDPVTKEKILIEPNPDKRAREFADKGGGIFGNIGKIGTNKSGGAAVDFESSNVLWKATLKTLDFLPLLNADYTGGIIIYDWYTETINSKEQVKVSVRFLNNELRSDSIKVTAHKKICESADKCLNITMDQKFSDSIKDSIIASARALKIEEAKKEKK